jgi:hypothetical protein
MDWNRTNQYKVIAIIFVVSILLSGCNENRNAVAPDTFAPPPSAADEKSGSGGEEKG